MDKNYCIGCDIWCGRSCRSYGNGISDLSVNGDGCSRPWIKIIQNLWGLLAANGNNSSGLLLYLVGRRNYPMNSIDSRQLVVMEKRKKAAGIGLVFVAGGAIGLLVCLGRVGL